MSDRTDAAPASRNVTASTEATATAAPGSKVLVKSFGCQMNVYDSERIGEMLQAGGYVTTEDVAEADLVVLNTCHIREKAVEKVYSDLGRIRQTKQARAIEGRDTTIVVAGCVAQAEGAEIARRAPLVDVVVGPQSYHLLPEIIARAKSEGRAQVETSFPEDDKFHHLPPRRPSAAAGAPATRSARAPTAFLTVQEGCDKFCTFCVVPYTRGAEMSRPAASILDEARRLVDRGVVELTLLGQNVNAYCGTGPDGRGWSLARLIDALAGIDGLWRLRYMTSHPRDMQDDLIAAHRDQPKLMPFLHLPFQAGSDRILAAMNRRHTAAEYLRLVSRIRQSRPDLVLSTDVIVGFPGETEADFAATLAVVREIGFAQAYSFKYSPRPGTPAADLGSQVEEAEKTDRLARLHELLESQQVAFNTGCVGRTMPVLFEKAGRKPGQIVGRSPYLQLVHAEAPDECLGRIIPVEITKAWQNSLSGVIKAV